MITVKTTDIEFINSDGYRKTRTFRMLTHSEDNKKLYYIGNTEFTKDEGNKQYLNIIKKHKVINKTVTETLVDDATYINNLEKSIDQHTQYIDNYKDQKSAEKYNAKLREKIERVRTEFSIAN